MPSAGVNVFEERSRDFSAGDRLQFTALNKDVNLSNRDLGIITGVNGKDITVALDGRVPRTVVSDGTAFRQFDHGYAVTSHSSQGLTTGRVIASIDTDSGRSLITRALPTWPSLAAPTTPESIRTMRPRWGRLAHSVTKTAAIQFPPPQDHRLWLGRRPPKMKAFFGLQQ